MSHKNKGSALKVSERQKIKKSTESNVI